MLLTGAFSIRCKLCLKVIHYKGVVIAGLAIEAVPRIRGIRSNKRLIIMPGPDRDMQVIVKINITAVENVLSNKGPFTPC